jgi:hypothetical protein
VAEIQFLLEDMRLIQSWGDVEQSQTHLDSAESDFTASLEVRMLELPDLRAASESRPIGKPAPPTHVCLDLTGVLVDVLDLRASLSGGAPRRKWQRRSGWPGAGAGETR